MPPYVVVSRGNDSTTYGGHESSFGFVAVFRTTNEGRIDIHISVGHKGKFRVWSKYSLIKTTPYFAVAAKLQQQQNISCNFAASVI